MNFFSRQTLKVQQFVSCQSFIFPLRKKHSRTKIIQQLFLNTINAWIKGNQYKKRKRKKKQNPTVLYSLCTIRIMCSQLRHPIQYLILFYLKHRVKYTPKEFAESETIDPHQLNYSFRSQTLRQENVIKCKDKHVPPAV